MNKNSRERIQKLRACMEKEKIDGVMIVSSDCHLSEYVGNSYKYREYFSGFDGSAGTLFVTSNKAYLLTDGRYYLQAERDLENTDITLVRLGTPGEPDIYTLISRELSPSDTFFTDGRFISERTKQRILSKCNVNFIFKSDILSNAAPDMPTAVFNEIYLLPQSLTGEDTSNKLLRLRKEMASHGASAHVICSLEETAWLYNLRGSDIENTPVFYAFSYVTQKDAFLFVNPKSVQSISAQLKSCGFTLVDYDRIYDFLANITAPSILADFDNINSAVIDALPKSTKTIDKIDPVIMFKAVKNEAEQKCTRLAHIHDGVAVARFMHYIKTVNKDGVSELSASDTLRSFRERSPLYRGDSFDTICAYGQNAAIVHYNADEEHNTRIENKGMLLVDSGGQYEGGTTDITRMFVLGKISDTVKRDYTLVLKAMLRLQDAVFPASTRGAVLDMLVREEMWKYGLDFRHGTGHGVGHMLSVHEGPNRFHYANNAPALVPGMITSDEPGLYVEKSHGIRIENEILCVEKTRSEYGTFLGFEALTLCPIDLDGIDVGMLEKSDKKRLNDYHDLVYRTLCDYMDEDEKVWLAKYTRKI